MNLSIQIGAERVPLCEACSASAKTAMESGGAFAGELCPVCSEKIRDAHLKKVAAGNPPNQVPS